jgi:hypothetical protein
MDLVFAVAGGVLLALAVWELMDLLFTEEGFWLLCLPLRAVGWFCITLSLPFRVVEWLVDYPRKRLDLSKGCWCACVGTVLTLAGMVWILTASQNARGL